MTIWALASRVCSTATTHCARPFCNDRHCNVRVIIVTGEADELRRRPLANGQLDADQPARPAPGVGPGAKMLAREAAMVLRALTAKPAAALTVAGAAGVETTVFLERTGCVMPPA